MHRFVIGAVVIAVAVSACSGDDDDGESTDSTQTTTVETEPEVQEPTGPAADVSEELTGGDGFFIGSPYDYDWDAAEFVQEEFVAAGTASRYVTDGEMTGDGRWTLEPGETADYRTRVLV